MAKQVCIAKIEQKRMELTEFEEMLTTQQTSRIASLMAAFNASKTIDEVYETQQAVITYLSQLIDELQSSSSQEELQSQKTYLYGLFITKRSQISDVYMMFTIEFGTEVSAKEAALTQEIQNATTLAQLNAIESKIIDEYVKLLEKDALNCAIKQIKEYINNVWNDYSSSAPDYEQLKNQILYVVDLCKDIEDINEIKRLCSTFENALGHSQDLESWNSVYCWLVEFYSKLFEPQVTDAVWAKLKITDITTYIKEAKSISQADERFNNVKAAYESLQNMVYIVNANFSEDVKIEIKVGSTVAELTNEIVSKVKVVVYYSDKTTKSFSLTSSMITVKDVDFTKVDNYFVNVSFKTGDYSRNLSLAVSVVPDMAEATVLNSYQSGDLFFHLNEDGISSTITMTLYSNGYLKFSGGYQGYFAYAFKEDESYIEVVFGKNSVYDTVLFEIENDKTFDYYKPTGEPIMEFNGRAVSLPTYIYVYSTSKNGTYSSAGKYIAICNFEPTSGDELSYVGCATYCTFDKENKKFTMTWIKGTSENVVYTWEDGFNELKEDLRERRAKVKEQIQQEWAELIEEGYDVSYWQTDAGMSGGYYTLLNRIDMATTNYQLQEILTEFTNIVTEVKNNGFSMNASPDFETYSFNIGQNDDVETFISDNLVGKTFKAFLMFGEPKTITITKEMVTYNGDPKTDGSIQFIVTYHDELYGDTGFAFDVIVMPSFEFGA